jgi:hypothetical protein
MLRRVADVEGVHIEFCRQMLNGRSEGWSNGLTVEEHSAVGRTLAALPRVSVTDRNVDCLSALEMKRQYALVLAHATEVVTRAPETALQGPLLRIHQVRMPGVVVADVLVHKPWYSIWRAQLEALRRCGVARLVVDAADDGGQFARLPASMVLVREAGELGITMVLRGMGRDRLTRACALRMARAACIELEGDACDFELALAERDADLDIARLGSPILVAAWASER